MTGIHVINQIGNTYVRMRAAFSGENAQITLRVSGSNTVTVTIEPSVAGGGTDRWLDGSFSYTISGGLVHTGDFYDAWDLLWSGVIGHGTQPYVATVPVFSADAPDAQAGGIASALGVVVTDCDGPAVTSTTSAVTSTTSAVTSTTSAVTSTSVAPTSTLPATGVGEALRISAPLGLGLLLAGLIALGGAALIGDRRRRQ